jgi:hypothetical protein
MSVITTILGSLSPSLAVSLRPSPPSPSLRLHPFQSLLVSSGPVDLLKTAYILMLKRMRKQYAAISSFIMPLAALCERLGCLHPSRHDQSSLVCFHFFAYFIKKTGIVRFCPILPQVLSRPADFLKLSITNTICYLRGQDRMQLTEGCQSRETGTGTDDELRSPLPIHVLKLRTEAQSRNAA